MTDFHNLNLDWILISIHTFLAEGDQLAVVINQALYEFQSTPSSRKVTTIVNHFNTPFTNFNPHLPRGRWPPSIVRIPQTCASPSARKVWIEIHKWSIVHCNERGHLPRGRCGLKLLDCTQAALFPSHLPRGRCGLKSQCIKKPCPMSRSPSARKVWIEIPVPTSLPL